VCVCVCVCVCVTHTHTHIHKRYTFMITIVADDAAPSIVFADANFDRKLALRCGGESEHSQEAETLNRGGGVHTQQFIFLLR
jgi:hypothetical protein